MNSIVNNCYTDDVIVQIVMLILLDEKCIIKVLFHVYDICCNTFLANQWWAINGLIHKDGHHCEKGEVAKVW